MKPLNIKLIFLGYFKGGLDKKRIEKFKSALFSITNIENIQDIRNDNLYPLQEFEDGLLITETEGRCGQQDMTVLICSLPLQEQWYMRFLTENYAVISLYYVREILLSNHIESENFIIKNILQLVALHHYHNNFLEIINILNGSVSENETIVHNQIKGCIFDMNNDKHDILFNTNSPEVCTVCSQKLIEKDLSLILKKLKKDLKKLKKNLFYRAKDFLQRNPVISVLIGIISTLCLGLLSNYISRLIDF